MITRTIPKSEVRLGMFIHSFEGSWLKHPFWRRRFLLKSQSDLELLLDSDVALVRIVDDLSEQPNAIPDSRVKPVKTSEPPEPIGKSFPPSKPARNTAALPRGKPRTALSPREEEMQRATETIQRSKRAIMAMFDEARMGKSVSAEAMLPLVSEITESVNRDPSIMINVARLKSKDEYTYLHSVAVCALMINLARQLKMEEARIRDLGVAGLLHDVGKMAIDDAILSKPGALTDDEFAIVRGHPEKGYLMLKGMTDVPAVALNVCLHHHEKIDGTGYPERLAEAEISLEAKMAAICDVYDAVTSQRSYNTPWSPSLALARMQQWTGHFDPVLLRAFISSLGILPDSTLVQLASGRLAIVYGVGLQDVTKPLVRAFWDINTRARCRSEDIDLSTAANEALLCEENPENWPFKDWESLCKSVVPHMAAEKRK